MSGGSDAKRTLKPPDEQTLLIRKMGDQMATLKSIIRAYVEMDNDRGSRTERRGSSARAPAASRSTSKRTSSSKRSGKTATRARRLQRGAD